MRITALIVLGCLVMASGIEAAETIDRRFLELSVQKEKHQGRKYVSDDEVCWLLERDGQLRNIELSQVTEFKQLGNTFRPYSTNELRGRLLAEFGKGYEVDARSNQVVIAPTGQAKGCAAVVETTAKSFTSYFGRRNLKLDKIETPLVTVVFKSHPEFLTYCDQDQIKQTNGLLGYYSPMTNRVALFLRAPADKASSFSGDIDTPFSQALAGPLSQLTHFGVPPKSSGFVDTLAHETTHQLGFNVGLHSRLGDDPKWIIEGMAMLFEGDANRDDTRDKTSVAQRMNRDRFIWFQEYQKVRREPKSLEDFLTSDALFTSSTLDAYSEAWALTFFLAETRSANLSTYLKKLANRTDLGEYTPMKRLNDFKACFSKDIPSLEMQYLRFMQELESTQSPATTATGPGQSPLDPPPVSSK